MAVLAIVVSVLAVLVAGASARYSRQQAEDTRRLARLEAERRREERTPRLVGEIESMNSGGWHRLWLRLESAEPLAHVHAEIIEGRGMSFTSGQHGVEPNGSQPLLATAVR